MRHMPTENSIPFFLMGGVQVLLFVGIAVIIVVAVIAGNAAARRRRQALAAWAAARGLAFSEARDPAMDERFPLLSCLRQGSDRYAHNICRGPVRAGDGESWGEGDLWAFDYHYETHSTDSKGRRTTHHHRLSVLLLQTALPLKPLHIRPEHFFDKVGEFFGADDIDFESAEFSRRFCVRSPDRRWAFDVITQEMMEFLLGAGGRSTINIENGRIAVYDNSTFSPPEFEGALRLVTGLLDRIQPSVIRELTEHA